ncbi:hypothetical protein [Cryptobacterium curtum]|uniref:hypothetical protein n=1 Tax=Cryptobacterium curtum TaxID=84163 RepID=UPI0028D79EDE|nr:hypothetical protein [Cryptobacterium curtum]
MEDIRGVTASQSGFHFADEVATASRTTDTDKPAIMAVLSVVTGQDRYREVLYKILLHCIEPHDAEEVEFYVALLPESRHSLQSPNSLITMLIDCGGLTTEPLDKQGCPIKDDVLERMNDSQRADAIWSYLLTTSQVGRHIVSLLDPTKRFHAQILRCPERRDAYLAVLEFCQQPRTLNEVRCLFASNPLLEHLSDIDSQPIACDFYLSELEKSGCLEWKNGWTTNDAGHVVLDGEHCISVA